MSIKSLEVKERRCLMRAYAMAFRQCVNPDYYAFGQLRELLPGRWLGFTRAVEDAAQWLSRAIRERNEAQRLEGGAR